VVFGGLISLVANIRIYKKKLKESREVRELLNIVITGNGPPTVLNLAQHNILLYPGMVSLDYLPEEAINPRHAPESIGDCVTTALGAGLGANVIIPVHYPSDASVISVTISKMVILDCPTDSFINIIVVYAGARPEHEDSLGSLKRYTKYLNKFAKKQGTSTSGIRVYLINCERSRSKSESIKYTLLNMLSNQHIEKQDEVRQIGEFTFIYNADQWPEYNSIVYGCELLRDSEADMIQGRCMIRNARSESRSLADMIALEFDMIQSFWYLGCPILHRFAEYNACWRTDVLKRVAAKNIHLGQKIIYDDGLVSYETAPINLMCLISHRLQLTQDWLQVAFIHISGSLRSKHIPLYRKMGIIILLLWREMYLYMAIGALPAWLAEVARIDFKSNNYLLAVGGLMICYSPIIVIIMVALNRMHVKIYKLKYRGLCTSRTPYMYIRYMALLILYEYLKFQISLAAHFGYIVNKLRR
jgi:hypothetical protein